MKDYVWLAVFSVFTLVVGILFTYGNSTRADMDTPPIQVFVTSTTTPSSPIVIREGGAPAEFMPPAITINVMIATSSLMASPQAATKDTSSSRTYYVTNNTTYATQDTSTTTEEEVEQTVTLTIQGVYEATTTPVVTGETLLALLSRLDTADPGLHLMTQDYGDLGTLVTAMGGFTNGIDGKYWQYQVDGIVPMVGADQYTLHDGQAVLWEFKGF